MSLIIFKNNFIILFFSEFQCPLRAKTSLSSSLSPGQEVQLRLIGQLLNQPTHPTTRRLLHDAYKVEAPQQGRRRRSAGRVHGQRAVGTTVAPLTRLPRANRRDALVRCSHIITLIITISHYSQNYKSSLLLQLSPPPISTIDVQKGLLSLLERGLIPVSSACNLLNSASYYH